MPFWGPSNTEVIEEIDALRAYCGKWFSAIQKSLQAQRNQGERFMGKFDDLQAAVAANQEVTQSAITLINGLADKLDDAAGDPALIAQLSADLRSQSQALADAITANTPAG